MATSRGGLTHEIQSRSGERHRRLLYGHQSRLTDVWSGPEAPRPPPATVGNERPVGRDAEFARRHGDARRGKGKSGGLRVIYYWWDGGSQFWLFTLYDKDEAADLRPDEKKAFKSMLKRELESRK